MRTNSRLLPIFAPMVLFVLLFNGWAAAGDDGAAPSRATPLPAITLSIAPIHAGNFLPPLEPVAVPLNLRLADYFVPASRGLLRPILLPRGGAASSVAPSNPDPTIPAPGQWLEVTGPSAGNYIAALGTFDCNKIEGGNPVACGANQAGQATATGSMSGTNNLIITALCAGCGINNDDVVAEGSGGSTVLTPGTTVVSGGPINSSSACLPSCTLVVSNAQAFASQNLVINPAGLQASTIASTINCGNLAFPFSGAAIDPDTGDSYIGNAGGHAAPCNALGISRFSIAAAKANGGTGNWTQVVGPARHVPLSYPIPGWLGCCGEYTAAAMTANPTDFYPGSNFNGEWAAPSLHQYNTAAVTPQGYFTFGGFFPQPSGGGAPGGGYFTDSNYFDVPIGPVIVPNNTSGGSITYPGLEFGYALEQASLQPDVPGAWGSDKNLYAVNYANGSNYWGSQLVNPFPGYKNGATGTQWNANAFASPACFQIYSSGVVAPDSFGGSPHLMMVARNLDTTGQDCAASAGPGFLQVVSEIDGGPSPGPKVITLSGSDPLLTDYMGGRANDCTGSFCPWALWWDADNQRIDESDGSRFIADFTPNNTTMWSVGLLTSSTSGSPPPDPPTTACNATNASAVAGAHFNINGAQFEQVDYCARIFRYGDSDPGCIGNNGTIFPGYATDPTNHGMGRVCTLTDSGGHSWGFSTAVGSQWNQPKINYQVTEDGSPVSGFYGFKMELLGGTIFIQRQDGAVTDWFDQNGNGVLSPGGSTPNVASIGATNYASLQSAVLSLASSEKIDLLGQTGRSFWVWNGADLGSGNNGAVSGVAISCPAGVALYAARVKNGEIISFDKTTNTTLLGCELGFDQAVFENGPDPCFSIIRDTQNVLVMNSSIHDCDHGGESGGQNGQLVFVNDNFYHNGGDTGTGAPAHNFYGGYPAPFTITGQVTGKVLTVTVAGGSTIFSGATLGGTGITAGTQIVSLGTGSGGTGTYNLNTNYSSPVGPETITIDPIDTTNVTINGGGSYALRNSNIAPGISSDVGSLLKLRSATGTISNFTMASVDPQHLYSDNKVLATALISCGGQYTIGMPDPVITPASLTSSSTTATVTLPSVNSTGGTYNEITGEVDLTIPSTNFLPGTPILISGVTGTDGNSGVDLATINGLTATTTGSGTTLKFFTKQTGLSITAITGATVQFELPFSVGKTFLTTVAGAAQTGYNGSFTATAASATTFTYTLGGTQTSPATGTITFTLPGGVVLEIGPDIASNTNTMVRYGDNASTLPGCPPSGTGYATNTLLIQNCWAINDSGATIRTNAKDLSIAHDYIGTSTITVKSCKIINPYATSLADALGSGVIDGGGNVLYHSRADAAAHGENMSAYPFLPMVSELEPANDNSLVSEFEPANDNALQAAA